jgi:hypothetical protein
MIADGTIRKERIASGQWHRFAAADWRDPSWRAAR